MPETPIEQPSRPQFAEALRLDMGLLESRLRFLVARAEWHEQVVENGDRQRPQSANMHSACAATLRRDAGAIALLLGQVNVAKYEFRRAGKSWLNLGFYEGLFLIWLAAGSSASDSFSDPIPSWIEVSLNPEGRSAEYMPRFANAALRSPRQLVSLVQAGDNKGKPVENFSKRAREILQTYRSYPLGVTQTPVERYVKLLEAVRRGEPYNDGLETLVGMSIRRSELITAAQEDSYHWHMALKPADIIDFDLLAVGLTALGRNRVGFAQVQGVASDHGPTAQLPFELAVILREPPQLDFDHSPRFK